MCVVLYIFPASFMSWAQLRGCITYLHEILPCWQSSVYIFNQVNDRFLFVLSYMLLRKTILLNMCIYCFIFTLFFFSFFLNTVGNPRIIFRTPLHYLVYIPWVSPTIYSEQRTILSLSMSFHTFNDCFLAAHLNDQLS